MSLDVRTIVVMLILSSLLMAVTLAVGNRKARAGGLAKWNLGLGLLALAWVLVAARGALPDIVTMAAADGLLLSGLCLQLAAVREFGTRSTPPWALYLPGPLLFLAVLPLLNDYTGFTVAVSAAYGLVFAAIAAQALRFGKSGGAARWMLAIAYAAGAAGLLARSGAMLADAAAYPGLFVQSAVHTAAFLGLFAVTCCGSIAFLLMLRERTEAELYRLATFDPLTGLFNRRAFMELAERELARARRSGSPCAVLMMDLDLFKRVNDEFGHQAGDRVLADFGAIAKGSVRTEDLVGRYGGEEFCAVLPATDLSVALEAAERVRAAVALNALGNLPRATTVSIGITVCGGASVATLDEIIARADEALYRAKKEGRNRVASMAMDSRTPPTPATALFEPPKRHSPISGRAPAAPRPA